MGSENGANAEIIAIGETVRDLRRRRGMSVEALSRVAEVSVGLISQLERGKGNPSFLTLDRLADALGITVVTLFSGEAERDDFVVRAAERQRLHQDGDPAGVLRELLTPGMHLPLQVIRTVLPAGFSNEGKPFRHIGTECVVVESGRLLVMHGDRRFELDAADAATYKTSIPHWWANAYDGETVVLGAVSPVEV